MRGVFVSFHVAWIAATIYATFVDWEAGLLGAAVGLIAGLFSIMATKLFEGDKRFIMPILFGFVCVALYAWLGMSSAESEGVARFMVTLFFVGTASGAIAGVFVSWCESVNSKKPKEDMRPD